MVVFIHVGLLPTQGTLQWWLYQLVGYDGILRVAVPYFFAVAGYLIAGKMHDSGWWTDALKRRMKTLLIPYCLWEVIAVVFAGCLQYGAKVAGYSIHSCLDFNLSLRGLLDALGLNPFVTPYHSVLWFVRSLLVFVLISPFLRLAWRKKVPVYIVIVLFVCAGVLVLVSQRFEEWHFFNVRFLSTEGLFCFWMGMGYRLGSVQLVILRSKVGSIFLAFLMWGIKSYLVSIGSFTAGYWVGWIATIISMNCIWLLVPERRWPGTLTSLAFPLYVIHPLVLNIVAGVIGGLGLRDYCLVSIWTFFVRGFIAIIMSLVVAVMINKISSPIAEILFGGRVQK